MSQESPRHPFLSDAELRALLDEAPAGSPALDAPALSAAARSAEIPESAATADTGVGSGGHVLILSRHDEAIDLLCDRSSTLGYRAEVVRNPFSALDRLRQSPVSILFSDADLWANGAALLFQRLPSFASVPQVVFLGASGERSESAASCPSLPLPLEPRAVELVFQRGAKSAALRAPKEKAAETREQRRLVSRSGEDGATPANPPPASETAELLWLRFFRDVYQAWRETDSLEDLRSRWLSASVERLGASAAEWVMLECGQWRGEVLRRDATESLDVRDASRAGGGLHLSVTVGQRREGERRTVCWSVLGVPPPVVERLGEYRADLEALLRAGVAKLFS